MGDVGTPDTVAATGPDTVDSLVLDLLEWIGAGSRPYDEVLDAWRTSCPRLPVWEEAKARGLVTERPGPPGAGRTVMVSPAGREHVLRLRPSSPPGAQGG